MASLAANAGSFNPFQAEFGNELVGFLVAHITRRLLPASKVSFGCLSELPGARLGDTIADEAHDFHPSAGGVKKVRMDRI